MAGENGHSRGGLRPVPVGAAPNADAGCIRGGDTYRGDRFQAGGEKCGGSGDAEGFWESIEAVLTAKAC